MYLFLESLIVNFFFLITLPAFASRSALQQLVWFLAFVSFWRCSREWTFTRLSLTASSRSTTSKATRPSASSSESAPSHPSHFRLSRHFQSSQHQSGTTSNTVLFRTLEVRPVGDRLAACCGGLRGLELPGRKFLTSFEKVNSQKGAVDVAMR